MNGDRRQFNTGDVLHIAQIVVMLVSLGIGYQKLADAVGRVDFHSDQLNRIEHYLSSHDANYWRDSRTE